MAQHGGAWRACGAAGEHEHRKVVIGDLDHRQGCRADEVGKRCGVVDVVALGGDDSLHQRHIGAVDAAPCVDSSGANDDRGCADRDEFAGELWCGARRVQRHGNCAKAHDGEIRHHKEAAVANDEGNAVALLHAKLGESAAQTSDLIDKRAVGGGAVTTDDRNLFGRMPIDDVCQIHRLVPPAVDVSARRTRARAEAATTYRRRESPRARGQGRAWLQGACGNANG